MKTTLTREQSSRRSELQSMNDRHVAAWKRHATFYRSSGSSASIEQQAAIRAELGFDFTNELRAELETLNFLAEAPARYFAYPSTDLRNVTGFMGNTLARITSLGSAFRSNMGDERRSFHAVGINGVRYVGTIYSTYLRMRAARL